MPMEATWDRFPPLDEYKLIPHAAQDAQLHMHNLQFPPDLVPDDQGHQGDTPDEDGNEVLNDYPQLQDPTRFPGDRTFIFWRPDPFNVQRPDPFGSGGPAVAQEDYPICFGKLQDAFQRKPQEWTEWKATWAMKKTLVGWFDIGDEKLPSYMGIIINHSKDPY